MKRRGLLLSEGMWDKFSVYLFVEKKLDSGKNNVPATRGKFNQMQKFFATREFNRDNFNVFIKEMADRKLAGSTLNNMIKLAKHFDKFMGTNEIQDFTSYKEVHRERIPLNPEEIQLLINTPYPYRRVHEDELLLDQVAIEFLYATGCRIEELQNLQWEDVRYEEYRYVIFRDTKNGTDHKLVITERIYNMLYTLPRISGTVFASKTGLPIDRPSFARRLKKKAEIAGIKKNVHPHIFRHSRGNYLAKLRFPDRDLANYFNHKNIESTKVYTHIGLSETADMALASPLEKTSPTSPAITSLILEFAYRIIDKTKYKIDIKISPVTSY